VPDERQTNTLLGYPEDARLLIVNADDFGMCHANNEGTLRAFKEGIVRSTTLMAPCPWAPHAMQLLKENPEIAFGVHLTLVSEHSTYRWGPVASKDKVSSLLDEAGYFFLQSRMNELVAQAKLDEVETEFRAQIAAVLRAGLAPTHLDWHCLGDGGRDDIFDLTFRLARELGLAIRAHYPRSIELVRAAGLPVNDHGILDSYSIETAAKPARYVELLRSLPAGLSEWAIHPSIGDDEAQAMEPSEWHVRRADFDFAISDQARALIEEEGIVLLNYRALQPHWSN
jgi:predicted glycoside hydrolase/deacetylase ChbG (UPF0249 family)